MNWATAITTVPQRLTTLLPKTVASLQNAGFTIDRLFIDGHSNHNTGLPATIRDTPVGVQGAWYLALAETFFRNRFADYYLIAQDDLLAVKNIRQYIEASPSPHGWMNLLSHNQNEHLAEKTETRGWFKSNQHGVGAVGLVFPNAVAHFLLRSPGFIDFALDPKNPRRYPRYVDLAVAKTLRDEFTEHCHYPSLLQHTGKERTVKQGTWHGGAEVAMSFPGEDWDALSMLEDA